MSEYSYCRQGAYPSILINNQRLLSKEQYREVLLNIRRTVNSEPLIACDDTTLGAKSTTVNWGLCSGRPDHYPDPRMHTFPKDFDDRERVSELRPPAGHDCHLRKDTPHDGSGCFWHCRVFRAKRGKKPERDQVIRWIDEKLEKVKNND